MIDGVAFYVGMPLLCDFVWLNIRNLNGIFMELQV